MWISKTLVDIPWSVRRLFVKVLSIKELVLDIRVDRVIAAIYPADKNSIHQKRIMELSFTMKMLLNFY